MVSLRDHLPFAQEAFFVESDILLLPVPVACRSAILLSVLI